MAGNIQGGLQASNTNKTKYGADFYKRIGTIGGKKSRNGGFGSDKIGPDGLTGRERARIAGRVGGLKSVRTGKVG